MIECKPIGPISSEILIGRVPVPGLDVPPRHRDITRASWVRSRSEPTEPGLVGEPSSSSPFSPVHPPSAAYGRVHVPPAGERPRSILAFCPVDVPIEQNSRKFSLTGRLQCSAPGRARARQSKGSERHGMIWCTGVYVSPEVGCGCWCE